MRRSRPDPRPALRRRLPPSVALLCLVALAACVPGATPALGAPSFRLDGATSRIVRLDPPGAIGEGALVVRVGLHASNPNPFAIRLQSLDGDLWLGGLPAGGLSFVGGLDLPAGGAAALALEVEVPVARIGQLAGVLGEAIAGRPIAYRVDAAAGVDVLGVPVRFPVATVARGEVRQPDLLPVAPRVRFDAAATGVREARFDRITLGFGLVVDNPGPLGFVVRAPDARLSVGGREVATIGVPATAVPAGGSASLVQEVVVDPVALGGAVASQLQALASGAPAAVGLALFGRWELDLGILGRWSSPVGELASGRID